MNADRTNGTEILDLGLRLGLMKTGLESFHGRTE